MIKKIFSPLVAAMLLPPLIHGAETSTASTAINTLGIELLARISKPDQNVLLSPYSIQSAMAMTYVGADGATRKEMAQVLHFPIDGTGLNASFSTLANELNEIGQKTAKSVAQSKQMGGPAEPITINVANRLFGQTGFEFRKPFLETVKSDYTAPFEPLDFIKESARATQIINDWVESTTNQRIRGLIPENALNRETRLVLVNAIYLKAAWANEFSKAATHPAPFLIHGTTKTEVPTMRLTSNLGYSKQNGYTAVTIPYIGGDLQFLILLPDRADGLSALESKLDAGQLANCATLESKRISISLPKFKMEPPTLPLGDTLQSLGMKSAFDLPRGSADFDRMAPRTPNQYLYISQIFHKTFLSLDENGTEAAAATAVVMMRAMMAAPEPNPIEVQVDHPFLFAIQHRSTGACLFLGRMTDPK